MISDVLNPILKTMTYNPEGYKDYGTPEYWSNMLRDGIIGAGLGAVGGGGQVVRAVGETAQSAKARNAESTQSTQAPAQPVDASQVIADMVTGKTGTRSDTAGQNTPQGGTKVNIDSAARPVYTGNSNINGGAQNVSRRSLEADSDGISGVYAERNADYQGQRGFDSVPIDSGLVLSAQAQNAIRSRGVEVVETKDVSANSAAFSAALNESRAANTQNGWAVTPKSTQEIAVNGTYYVIEAVPDTAKKTTYIVLVSAYMSKNGAKKTAPSSVFGNNALSDTSETAARVAVGGTLSQEAADVNPRNEQTSTSALEAEQSNLPKGTGAAELGFTGEMTAADQWVAEAQGQGDDALHPISEESQGNNLAEQAPVRWAVERNIKSTPQRKLWC